MLLLDGKGSLLALFSVMSLMYFKYKENVSCNQIRLCFRSCNLFFLKVKMFRNKPAMISVCLKIFWTKMTDGSIAFMKIWIGLEWVSQKWLAEHFTCWGETASVRQTKRLNNVLTWTVLARCHPRLQSQVSKGDGPSVLRTEYATDGLRLVLWSMSIFLLPLVPGPDTNAPDDFHMKSNPIPLFDVGQLRGDGVK